MSSYPFAPGSASHPIARVEAAGGGYTAPALGLELAPPRGAGAHTHSELATYWRMISSRRWFLLATTLLGLAVAAFITFRQPRLYVAQATVEFKKALPPGKSVDLDSLGRSAPVPPELATRLLTTKILAAQVIAAERARGPAWFDPAVTGAAPRSIVAAAWDNVRSWFTGGVAVARLVVAPKPAVVTADAPPADDWDAVGLDIINRYYAGITAAPVRGTSLVDLKVTSPDPVLAARIANTHVQAFIDMDAKTKVASLSDAQGLLGRQLTEVREQLEASRRALADYQLEHGIFNLPKGAVTLSRQSLQQLNKLLTKSEGDRIVAEATYRNAAGLSSKQLSATLPDGGVQALREQLLAMEAAYQSNLQHFGSNHPDMVAQRARLAALQEQLTKEAEQARTRLQAVFEAARAKESGLRANLAALSANAGREDRDLVQLSLYQRDAESNAQLYASVLDQAKTVNLVNAAQWTNVALVDRAVAPTTPSFPDTRHTLLGGILFGLIGGLLGCVLIERLDTTINTPEEMVTQLDLPAFGVIPDFRRLGEAEQFGRSLSDIQDFEAPSSDLVTLLRPFSVVSEAYRAVRTNLMFALPDHPPKVVLVTSSQAGEGKSATTINLAITLTLSGARVLVIDADLRKPTCHQLLRVPGDTGLSNVLAGQIGLDEAIQRSPLCPISGDTSEGAGLFILPAGRVPPNPAELLGSQRMTTVLATAREQFDFVLIDSPPIIPVTDSIVLATKADGVLLVISGGEWSRDVVLKALAQLDGVHSRVLGGLLNKVNITGGRYADYYHQLYQGYPRRGAYGHGYGRTPETEDAVERS